MVVKEDSLKDQHIHCIDNAFITLTRGKVSTHWSLFKVKAIFQLVWNFAESAEILLLAFNAF